MSAETRSRKWTTTSRNGKPAVRPASSNKPFSEGSTPGSEPRFSQRIRTGCRAIIDASRLQHRCRLSVAVVAHGCCPDQAPIVLSREGAHCSSRGDRRAVAGTTFAGASRVRGQQSGTDGSIRVSPMLTSSDRRMPEVDQSSTPASSRPSNANCRKFWDSSFTCRFVESRVADRSGRPQNGEVGSADQPVRRRHPGSRTTPKALKDAKTSVAAIATPRSGPR
jgi:hypothetical protein